MAATLPLEVQNDVELFLEQELHKELLRFTTAGSVDDGKSTLIGRLLHDCKAVYEDQLDSVKKSRINRSGRAVDFSLLTDGLRAEREQGITIDVAYRYFSTARRKFIIADTPGHEQYTRNMATGASTADLAVILIDASKGLLPQTRRHAYIASLLGIPHVLAAVNKMDLVEFREDVFSRLAAEFEELATALGIPEVQCVPVSALDGDNIVARSEKTLWYSGPTLLEHLESVPIRSSLEMDALRFPVQSVIRPDATFRGFAGRLASGTVRPGDEILALPSQQKTRVHSIVTFDGDVEAAGPTQSLVLKLTDEIDLSRGDLLVAANAEPHISSRFSAMVVWLHTAPLQLHRAYLTKHLGRQVKIQATRIRFRVDVNTLREHAADHLEMNEIALVEFETSQPLYFDPYRQNRTTGSLILIEPLTNATVGAVMIQERLNVEKVTERRTDETIRTEKSGALSLEERIQRHRHSPAIFAFTGERYAVEALERTLAQRGFETAVLIDSEVPNAVRQSLLTTLWNLGLIVLFWSAKRLRTREQALFADIAGKSFFDLSDVESRTASDAVRIAESLRIGASRQEYR